MLKDALERLKAAAVDVREVAHNHDDSNRSEGELAGQWQRANDEYDSILRDIERDDNLMPPLNVGTGDNDRCLALQAWVRAANELPISAQQQNACKRLGINPKAKQLGLSLGTVQRHSGHGLWTQRGVPMLAETRDLGVGTPGSGQETVPAGFVRELEKTMLSYNGPRRVCRIWRTASGNPMPWPTVDDTGNEGAILAENTSIGSSVDPIFGQVTFGAYKYSSQPILVAEELMDDTAFNLANELGELLGIRIGRKTEGDFTNGNGTSEPQGLATAAQAGVVAATPTSFAADDYIDLAHSVDYAYRSSESCGYMVHDLIMRDLRKLKDGDGQYLWEPSLQRGVPDRFNGFPIAMNQHLAPAPVADATVALFGAFQKYLIRDAAELRFYRLTERYRDADQTGFVVFSRHDAKLLAPTAVKKLVQPSS